MIQVSYAISDEKTKARELSAFHDFAYLHAEQKLLITHSDNYDAEGVTIVSFEKFALGFECEQK